MPESYKDLWGNNKVKLVKQWKELFDLKTFYKGQRDKHNESRIEELLKKHEGKMREHGLIE